MFNQEKSKYILAISELNSFSKAAEKLFVAQSSLSRYVSDIEKELGVDLFDRSKLPISLTYAGERYIDYLKQFIELNNKMIDEFKDLRNTVLGTLNVGSFALMGTYVLPAILPIFLKQFPHINIKIKNQLPNTFEQSLENGSIDLCVINLPPKHKKIEYIELAKDKLLLIAAVNSPLAKRYHSIENNIDDPLIVDLKTIENEKFIILPKNHNMRTMADSVFKHNEIAPFNILEVPNLNMAVDLVSANIGLSFVCKTTMLHKKMDNPLTYFSVGDLEVIPSIILAYTKKDSDLITAFLEISKEVFENYSV